LYLAAIDFEKEEMLEMNAAADWLDLFHHSSAAEQRRWRDAGGFLSRYVISRGVLADSRTMIVAR